jgi:hypothetical protein
LFIKHDQCVLFAAVKNIGGMNDSAFGLLIAGKSDLREGAPPTRAEVSKTEMLQTASDLGLPLFEVSSVR